MAEQIDPLYVGRTLVVMLCMHRSGSSLVTNLLQRLGMSLGPFELLGTSEHNKHGHFEAVPMYRLNQELLTQVFGFSDDVPDSADVLRRFCACEGQWRLETSPGWQQRIEQGRKLVEQLVTSGPICGFKDPRVPLLWPFWKHVFSGFAGLRVVPIFLVRSPHEIAMSIFMRSKGSLGYYHALDVTAVHYRWLNRIHHGWDGERAVVRFDPRVFTEDLRRAAEVCRLDWSEEVFSQVFDATCKHHEPAAVEHPAEKLFRRLSRLRTTERDPANRRRLEQDAAIRESVMQGQLTETQQEVRQARLTAEQYERQNLEQDRQHRQQNAEYQRQNAEYQRQISRHQQEIRHAQQQTARYQQANLQYRQQDLQHQQESLRYRQTEESHRARIAQLENRLALITQSRTWKLRGSLVAAAQHIPGLWNWRRKAPLPRGNDELDTRWLGEAESERARLQPSFRVNHEPYGDREEKCVPMKPKVSIIIPFRDEIGLLQECLGTLAIALDSSLDSVEVLLLDNRSCEGAVEHLRIPRGLSCRTVNADFDFNFQTLQNIGAREASGDFLLLLNSDVVFTKASRGFLEAMQTEAQKPNVGAVGCLLWYPDGTIQHAGAVVGMNGWADHVYRGWSPAETRFFPFSSFRKNRDVSAVTAACLMVEKSKFFKAGGFDERFVVCGGDVDFCLRLLSKGYTNRYLGSVEMVHLESKTRDPAKVPPGDFVESRRAYDAFLARNNRRNPYFPAWLPLKHQPPREYLREASKAINRRLNDKLPNWFLWLVRRLKAYALDLPRQVCRKFREEPVKVAFARMLVKIRRLCAGFRVSGARKTAWVPIVDAERVVPSHLLPLRPRTINKSFSPVRLNIVFPGLAEENFFGGAITASILAFCMKLHMPSLDLRFLFVAGSCDPALLRRTMLTYLGPAASNVVFTVEEHFHAADYTVDVHENDFFLGTIWYSCLKLAPLTNGKPFFYLVQDYEPGFYPWSDDFAGAYSTYHLNCVPIFNTTLLRDFFLSQGFFPNSRLVAFEPPFVKVKADRNREKQKKKLLFYARPGTPRNLFITGIHALMEAAKRGAFGDDWEILSAGESHWSISLAPGIILRSLGKLPLEEYKRLLSEIDIGLSLMLSPHPSYPPLEMAAAGAWVVTNSFANKDLAKEFSNVISCPPSAPEIAQALVDVAARVRQGETAPARFSAAVVGDGDENEWLATMRPVCAFIKTEMDKACSVENLDPPAPRAWSVETLTPIGCNHA